MSNKIVQRVLFFFKFKICSTKIEPSFKVKSLNIEIFKNLKNPKNPP